MAKDINKMTNKELKAYCDTKGIDVDSKNVSKPTKTEYLVAISKFNIEKNAESSAEDLIDTEGLTDEDIDALQELGDVDDFLDISDDTPVAPVAKKKKQTRSEKRKEQWDTLMPLRRVLITSNSTSQTTTKNQVHYCTWGNRLLGHQTDRFIVGKSWHVREGALRNLENMEISNPIQDDEGNTVKFESIKAYVIQRLDQLTLDELQIIGKRQIIRDSSIENVI